LDITGVTGQPSAGTVIAVAAVDVRSGRRHERNAHVPLPAASTIKVLVSAALWSGVCAGRIDPERRMRVADTPVPGGGGLLESMHPQTELTLAELDLLMLAVSDNAATNAVIGAVGMDAVNDLAAALGLGHTRLRRRMMDVAAAERGEDNTTTAADMAALLCALARADGIPARACRRVLAAMAQSHHADIVPRYLPAAPSRVVSSKQGELAAVRHDVALVDEGERRIAIAVLSAPAAAAEGLARAAALAYRLVAAPHRPDD
jgi:beta-lactamase class A